MATARDRRKAGLERMNDPILLRKIEVVIETCDEALVRAADQLKAAEALLTRYAVYNDNVYQCSLKDIREIYYNLAKVVAYRATLDEEEHVRRLAAGRMGAELQRLGDDFDPEAWLEEQRRRAEAKRRKDEADTIETVRALRKATG